MIKIDKRIYQQNITLNHEDILKLNAGESLDYVFEQQFNLSDYDELQNFDELQIRLRPPAKKVDLEYDKRIKGEYKVGLNPFSSEPLCMNVFSQDSEEINKSKKRNSKDKNGK